jgi:hypothetical protein
MSDKTKADEALELQCVTTIVRAARGGDHGAADWLRERLSTDHLRSLLDGPSMPSVDEVAKIVKKHAARRRPGAA